MMESVDEFEYSKKDLIGHGAFAVVFKGRHKKKHDFIVAIKAVTKKNLAKSQNLLSKEIKILKELSSLHHDNVVALLDCKETAHHVYLIMEYCDGGDLADYLQVKGTLSEDTIALFLKQIAGAMEALNAKGIVHRDLKPQNLLLCNSGKPNPPTNEIILKIADFGFARFLQDGVMAATLCGSPMYMAPEVIMSLQYDAKADLWSIGTIVFQCLTGKAPFQAQTPQQLKQFYEKNSDLAPNIPSGTSAELKDLLYRMLKRNARDRIDFDTFFNHPFLNSPPRASTAPVSVPGKCASRGRLSSGSSPKLKEVSASPLSGNMPRTASGSTLQKLKGQPDTDGSPRQLSGFVKFDAKIAGDKSRQCASPTDDFVIVPSNISMDHVSDSPQSQKSRMSMDLELSKESPQRAVMDVSNEVVVYRKPQTSPSRPSVLHVSPNTSPSSQPIPVPSQIQAYEKMQRSNQQSPISRQGTKSSPALCKNETSSRAVAIPRKSSNTSMDSDYSGNVRFTVGTPPSNSFKRNSFGTPPKQFTPPSPARRSTGHCASPASLPAITDSPLRLMSQRNTQVTAPINTPFGSARVRRLSETGPVHGYHCCSEGDVFTMNSPPSLRSSTLPDNLAHCVTGDRSADVSEARPFGASSPPTPIPSGKPVVPFAVTRPRSESGSHERHSSIGFIENPSPNSVPYAQSPPNMEGPIVFEAPELAEETLMDQEHNETVSKLNFVLLLSECIIDLAQSRSTPITQPMQQKETDCFAPSFVSESQRNLEQLVLYVRALQMLSSSLELSRDEIRAGRLQPSNSVRSVVKELHSCYHGCLEMCKHLKECGLHHVDSSSAQLLSVTADRLIYNHAIHLCQTALLDEMFGNRQECFRRYQSAQVLFHSLAQQADNMRDKELLNKYRESVEKRLVTLQGYVYGSES